MTNLVIKVNEKEPITFKEAMKGLKKLTTRKDYDTLKLSFEMLKLLGNDAKKWIYDMIKKAIF